MFSSPYIILKNNSQILSLKNTKFILHFLILIFIFAQFIYQQLKTKTERENMLKKIKKNILAIAILVTFAGVLSSCYYDYGVDSEDSNIVGTLYDNTYPFNTVTKYILDPTVNKLGDPGLTTAYDATIINTVTANLTKLGWVAAAPGDSLAVGVVRVSTAIASSTYTVYTGGGWYGGGYYYGYPYYGGGYTYTYTTGTVMVGIADPKNTTQTGIWTGLLNGVTGQANPNGLITTGINQAFSNA
ncbi:MAG: DUF4136 domain-containing protein, partial [Ignavibacteria bacterium]|nr:DUF4136 domain-containing protein [Ignavibacteria bacterium]